MRKWRRVRIYGMKYSWMSHKDRQRHKNRVERSGQAQLVYVKDMNCSIPIMWRWTHVALGNAGHDLEGLLGHVISVNSSYNGHWYWTTVSGWLCTRRSLLVNRALPRVIGFVDLQHSKPTTVDKELLFSRSMYLEQLPRSLRYSSTASSFKSLTIPHLFKQKHLSTT